MTTDGRSHETRDDARSRHLEYERCRELLDRAIAEAERHCEQLAVRLTAVDRRASQVVHRLRAAGRIQPAAR